MRATSFEHLDVWNRAMALAEEVYASTRELPPEERFGLSIQLRRAAVSIPSNIAEGSGYGPSRRNIHHVRIALGSNLELQTQLMLIKRLGMASEDQIERVTAHAIAVGKMLNGLAKALERLNRS